MVDQVPRILQWKVESVYIPCKFGRRDQSTYILGWRFSCIRCVTQQRPETYVLRRLYIAVFYKTKVQLVQILKLLKTISPPFGSDGINLFFKIIWIWHLDFRENGIKGGEVLFHSLCFNINCNLIITKRFSYQKLLCGENPTGSKGGMLIELCLSSEDQVVFSCNIDFRILSWFQTSQIWGYHTNCIRRSF